MRRYSRIMKRRMSNNSPPKPASGEKMMSKSEMQTLQTLIQQEVHSAMKQKEIKLEVWSEDRMEQMQRELSFGPIDKLEADMIKSKLSVDAARAYIRKMVINRTEDHTQKKTAVQPVLSDVATTPTAPPAVAEDKRKKPIPHGNITSKHSGEQSLPLSPVVRVKLEISREDTEDEVIDTASHMGKNAMEIKEELVGTMRPDIPDLEEQEEQKARVEVDHIPGDSSPKQIYFQKDGSSYLPLPIHHFPSFLSMQAASYNIPQRPKVTIGHIRKPRGITLRWDLDVGPSAPPMDSYSVYRAVENAKGSGVFLEWRKLSEVRPTHLPHVCALITRYKPGYRNSITVVGKDKFGRCGPYSHIVSTTIHD